MSSLAVGISTDNVSAPAMLPRCRSSMGTRVRQVYYCPSLPPSTSFPCMIPLATTGTRSAASTGRHARPSSRAISSPFARRSCCGGVGACAACERRGLQATRGWPSPTSNWGSLPTPSAGNPRRRNSPKRHTPSHRPRGPAISAASRRRLPRSRLPAPPGCWDRR